ncbi:MAG: phosphoketolase family protein [Candidatus Nanopelagicales bacterium]
MATATDPLSAEELAGIDAFWRACNYLTVGQIYLQDNPLLRRPLASEDIKPRLLGHWGTSPGLSFIYAHANALIRRTGQDCIYLTGPGHGGPALVAAAYLEGTYTEVYPGVTQDEQGMQRLFRQFSSPGGIPSHVSVTTPGSIHEGGELGYVLMHAFGAVFDNPDLLAIAVVGDGEAETGPLEGSWKGISFLNPAHDGAVLPILHLNGYKIAGPTVLARKDPEDLRALLSGHGYDVLEVGGDDIPGMHHRFHETLATAHGRITAIQQAARTGSSPDRVQPRWPVIVLRTPKGGTGPWEVDGVQVTDSWRSHQVPLSGVKDNPGHLAILDGWMRSYRPDELFDGAGRPAAEVRRCPPEGAKRLSATPYANGGSNVPEFAMRDMSAYAVDVPAPGVVHLESTRQLGAMMRDYYVDNPTSFRLASPDESNSNRVGAVLEVSDRAFMGRTIPSDVAIGADGRVMEVLSEHNCHGWIEAYTLTGRQGLFATYEAFAMVSASMTIQHAKWLEEAHHLPWRAPVPSLNILLTSTCWRNDHNGFSHQGPDLIQNVINKRGTVSRIYFPPDANSLVVVGDHCFRTQNRVNLIVIDKQPQLQYLTLEQAREHVERGASIWEWAGNEGPGDDPDIVLASAGDVVTMESLAAAQILRERVPDLHVRFVNVVDIMSLIRPKDHPHGMTDRYFDELFTDDRDVIFAFHGYAGAVHQVVHGRPDADRFRARGFQDHGTTTTPFDMVVRNKVDRYHLTMDALNNAHRTVRGSEALYSWCEAQLERHGRYVVEHLQDLPQVRDWTWGAPIERGD